MSGAKEVEICDELEAFFYVLLYYGVRYLHSNIDESAVGTWISSFFDTYGVIGDTYVCGDKKLAAIESGKLSVVSNTTLEFGSPLDHLIKNFLTWFKANHVVSHYWKAKREAAKELKRPPSPEDVLPQVPDAEPSSPQPMRKRRRGQRADDSDDEVVTVRELTFDNDIVQPSAEEWDLHPQALKHKPMMKLLEKIIDAVPKGYKPWRSNDKVGDRVAKNFRPPILPGGPTLPASLASNKRRKVDGPEFAVSMPLLAAQRPPKTPERKQPFIPHYVTGYVRSKQP